MTGDDIVDPPWPGTPSARDNLVDQLGPEAPKRRRCQRCHGIVTEEVTIVPSKGEISMPRQVYAATVVPDPLADLRILDLTNEAGVLTGRILADLGADVLMVEPPEGSAARWIAPFVDGEADRERSFRHLYFNANKRSAVLDLSSSGGQEAFRSLVHEADVLLETAMPGEREALGLGHRELRAINPGLIQVSITPFGVDSDRAAWKGNDLTASAASGLLQISGERDDPPTHGPAFPAYTMSSLTALSGTLIALHGRETTPGRPGAHLDISMQKATSLATVQTSNPNHYAWRGEIPVRPALSQTMRCADGKWVGANILATALAQFISLLDEAGIEHEFDADNWQVQHVDSGAWKYLENPLQWKAMELAATMPRDVFLKKMWEMGSAAMPTLDFPQMMESEHYQVSGQFRPIEHERLGRSLEFSRSPVDGVAPDRPIVPAPQLGAQTGTGWGERGGSHLSKPEASMSAMPLAGIRVVDFTWVLAGPLGTRMLSNFGADVIKVESSQRMDALRGQRLPGGRYHTDLGDLLNDANTGKKSVTLDLKTEQGRDLTRRLIAKSDVVVNNYTAGKLAAMGFPYEELRRLNPKLIVLHLPGVGGDSPWVSHRTLGNLLMAASGQNFLMGFPDRPPRGMGVAYPDFTSPHLLVASVLSALREAERSGEGREILLSQLSATVSLLGAEWMRFRKTGRAPEQPGNRDPNYCPHGVYPTRGNDEWIAIAVRTEEEWAPLARLIGGDVPGAWTSMDGRQADEDELDRRIAAWTAKQDRWELAQALQEAGVAAAPVETLRDMMEVDPQMTGHYQRVHQPSDPDWEITIDGESIRFAGEERVLERAPMFGEHNEYVLRDVVGLTQHEFDELVTAGVIA